MAGRLDDAEGQRVVVVVGSSRRPGRAVLTRVDACPIGRPDGGVRDDGDGERRDVRVFGAVVGLPGEAVGAGIVAVRRVREIRCRTRSACRGPAQRRSCMVSWSSSASEAKSDDAGACRPGSSRSRSEATGGVFGTTVMSNVATFESSNPSFAFQVNCRRRHSRRRACTCTSRASTRSRAPWAGAIDDREREVVAVVVGGSERDRPEACWPGSSPRPLGPTGGVFGMTVMANVATFESLVPSLACQVKLSGPSVVGRRGVRARTRRSSRRGSRGRADRRC